jgi:DNA mismatch repair protein MutL
LGKIAILAPEVVRQIAAGEVIERPASVVKELVENSIDADSTAITVEIKDAGMKEIKVLDNGCGMTEEEVLVAVRRHATSKIKTSADLAAIKTLGFRGEALPSIAAVSRFSLITRTSEMVAGTRLLIEGGEIKEVAPVGCPPGTQVIVNDLFYNTPPRKKFLRSPATEKGIITDLMTRFALGYPEISFHLISNKKSVLKTPGRGSLLEVLSIIYGKEAAQSFLEVVYEEEGILVKGYVSSPELTRASRHHQSIFVNRRLVRNHLVTEALEESYHGLIPRGRYPLAVIFLFLSPAQLDVNVHPTKTDVRFQEPRIVSRVVRKGVQQTLEDFSRKRFFVTLPSPKLEVRSSLEEVSTGSAEREKREQLSFWETRAEYKPREEEHHLSFSKLRVVGQAQSLYIIAEGDDGIYFIDQHAAHERIRYEEILKHFASNIPFVHELGIPVIVRLTPEEEELYNENKGFLTQLGFTLEPYGEENDFRIITVPCGLREAPEEFLKNVLDLFRETKEQLKTISRLHEEVAALYACKSSIKAGDLLTIEAMEFLLNKLDAVKHHTCPHGRPIYFKLDALELMKRFSR